MSDLGFEKWYYADNGGRQGPVLLDDLRALVLQGGLKSDDLVWTKGMADWQPGFSVPTLSPKATPSPPLPTRATAYAEQATVSNDAGTAPTKYLKSWLLFFVIS